MGERIAGLPSPEIMGSSGHPVWHLPPDQTRAGFPKSLPDVENVAELGRAEVHWIALLGWDVAGEIFYRAFTSPEAARATFPRVNLVRVSAVRL